MSLLFDYLSLNENFIEAIDKINKNLRIVEEKFGPEGKEGLPGFIGLPGRPGFRGTSGVRGLSDKLLITSTQEYGYLSTTRSINEYYEILYQNFGILTELEYNKLIEEDEDIEEILQKIQNFEDIINGVPTAETSLNIYVVIQGVTTVRKLIAIGRNEDVILEWENIGTLVESIGSGVGGDSFFVRPNKTVEPVEHTTIEHILPREVGLGVAATNLFYTPSNNQIVKYNRDFTDAITANLPLRNILNLFTNTSILSTDVKDYDHKLSLINSINLGGGNHYAPLLLLGNIHNDNTVYIPETGEILNTSGSEFHGSFYSLGIKKQIIGNDQNHEFTIVGRGAMSFPSPKNHYYSLGLYLDEVKLYDRLSDSNFISLKKNGTELEIDNTLRVSDTLTVNGSTSNDLLRLNVSSTDFLRVHSSSNRYNIQPALARTIRFLTSTGNTSVDITNTGRVGIAGTASSVTNENLLINGITRSTTGYRTGSNITVINSVGDYTGRSGDFTSWIRVQDQSLFIGRVTTKSPLRQYYGIFNPVNTLNPDFAFPIASYFDDGTGLIYAYGNNTGSNTGLFIRENGNVNIGAGNISYLDTFSVTGDSRFNGNIKINSETAITDTRRFRATNGALTTPAYAFTNATNTGMWAFDSNTLAFSANGIQSVRMTPNKLQIRGENASIIETVPILELLSRGATNVWSFRTGFGTGDEPMILRTDWSDGTPQTKNVLTIKRDNMEIGTSTSDTDLTIYGNITAKSLIHNDANLTLGRSGTNPSIRLTRNAVGSSFPPSTFTADWRILNSASLQFQRGFNNTTTTILTLAATSATLNANLTVNGTISSNSSMQTFPVTSNWIGDCRLYRNGAVRSLVVRGHPGFPTSGSVTIVSSFSFNSNEFPYNPATTAFFNTVFGKVVGDSYLAPINITFSIVGNSITITLLNGESNASTERYFVFTWIKK